jgi:hypothetical protein
MSVEQKKVIHVLSDGRIVKTVAGLTVPLTPATKAAYAVLSRIREGTRREAS